jgi:hypothetical protein
MAEPGGSGTFAGTRRRRGRSTLRRPVSRATDASSGHAGGRTAVRTGIIAAEAGSSDSFGCVLAPHRADASAVRSLASASRRCSVAVGRRARAVVSRGAIHSSVRDPGGRAVGSPVARSGCSAAGACPISVRRSARTSGSATATGRAPCTSRSTGGPTAAPGASPTTTSASSLHRCDTHQQRDDCACAENIAFIHGISPHHLQPNDPRSSELHGNKEVRWHDRGRRYQSLPPIRFNSETREAPLVGAIGSLLDACLFAEVICRRGFCACAERGFRVPYRAKSYGPRCADEVKFPRKQRGRYQVPIRERPYRSNTSVCFSLASATRREALHVYPA